MLDSFHQPDLAHLLIGEDIRQRVDGASGNARLDSELCQKKC